MNLVSSKVYDYFKSFQYLERDSILKHPNLDFKYQVNQKTGEIVSPLQAEANRLKFTFYDSDSTTINKPALKIQGSLHKCYNSLFNPMLDSIYERGFNGNDFSFSNLQDVQNYISNEYSIDLKQSRIRNIEAGFNISTSFKPQQVLDGLLLHNGTVFSMASDKECREAVHSRYRHKCYDKGSQYNLKENIMRIENNYTRLNDVHAIGCNNVMDLTNRDVYERFKGLLLKTWGNVLLYDFTLNKEQMTPKEKTKSVLLSNPIYWKSLESNRRDRPKKQLQLLTQKYSQNIQSEIGQMIEHKFQKLSNA